jgi:opacity protein-like surface antigen
MRLQSNLKLLLAIIFVSASTAGMAQTAPAATKGGWPIEVGGGISVMDPDYGPGYPEYGDGLMVGGTVWLDYLPTFLPRKFNGLGIEAEGRELDFHRSGNQPKNLKEETGGGGVIYRWHHFDRLLPYGKFLYEYGNAVYGTGVGYSYHQTRTLTEMGGGLEYRVWRGVWARADYDYQRWSGFYYIGPGQPAPSLEPQGGTIGVMYSFRDQGR